MDQTTPSFEEEEKLSQTTINVEFFDKLWPLILEENVCEVKGLDNTKHFVPERKFDHVWAHDVLAQEAYKEYRKPIEFSCKIESIPAATAAGSKESVESGERVIEQKPYRTPVVPIQPLDEQLAAIECDRQLRKKLAHDFANRVYPWYMQRPLYEYDFVITDEMKKEFSKPFEYEILHNIKVFQCKLMIIDMAIDVELTDLERWQKFSNYVGMIVVAHSPDTFRKLESFNHIFSPVQLEEYAQNTWQDELNRALRIGFNHAKQLHLYNNDARHFIFVFCSNRGICTCDTYSVLKRK